MGQLVTTMVSIKKQPELKKHAATIHCSSTLSLLQRKISNALLYHAYKNLLTQEEHMISIKQLCQLIAYQGNNHAVIKDALKGLLATVIEWNLVHDVTGVEDWTASTMLASVSLQSGKCFYAYSPRMKQLLHSPTMFGKINLFVQSQFKSSYGLALYENCIRYRGLPSTKWFEIDVFRKLMGVPPTQYDIFRDFKRRVLDKAMEEVNTYSDLIVDADIYREGRKVIKIRFNLKERVKKSRLGVCTNEKPEDNHLLAHLIQHYGLGEIPAQQLIEKFGAEYIREKMTVIESAKNYQQGKVHNLAAYLFSALKNNYQAPKPALVLIDNKYEENQRLKVLEQGMEKIHAAYVAYRESSIDKLFHTLPIGQQPRFLQEFTEYAQETIQAVLKLQRNKYTRETVLTAPAVQAALRNYIYTQLAGEKEILSIIEYVKTLSPTEQTIYQDLQQLDPNHRLLSYESNHHK